VRRVLLLASTAGVLGMFAAPAGAATTIGQTAPFTDCGSSYGQVQTQTGASPSYTVPSDGMITSFSAAGDTVGAQTRLLILQPVSGSTYNVVAKSDFGTFGSAGVQTFPTQIAVHAGQVIGQFGNVCGFDTGNPADSFHLYAGSDPAIGANQDFTASSSPGARIDISANLEPNAAATGQRAAALKKCKKKHSKKARSKCRKKAKKLPA
jgi:hypothetical protein